MWNAQTYVKRQNFWEKCILSNCQYSRKVHYVIKVHINEFTKSNGRSEFRNIIWWDIGGENKFKPFFFLRRVSCMLVLDKIIVRRFIPLEMLLSLIHMSSQKLNGQIILSAKIKWNLTFYWSSTCYFLWFSSW